MSAGVSEEARQKTIVDLCHQLIRVSGETDWEKVRISAAKFELRKYQSCPAVGDYVAAVDKKLSSLSKKPSAPPPPQPQLEPPHSKHLHSAASWEATQSPDSMAEPAKRDLICPKGHWPDVPSMRSGTTSVRPLDTEWTYDAHEWEIQHSMPDGDYLDYYKLDTVPVRVNLDSAFMCVGCGVDQPPHQAGPDPRVTRYTIAHYHGAPAVYDWDSPECTVGLPPRHQCSSCRELSDARDAQRAREADAARDEWQTQLAEAKNEEQEEARTRGRENQKRKRKEKQDGQLRRLAATPEGRPLHQDWTKKWHKSLLS